MKICMSLVRKKFLFGESGPLESPANLSFVFHFILFFINTISKVLQKKKKIPYANKHIQTNASYPIPTQIYMSKCTHIDVILYNISIYA